MALVGQISENTRHLNNAREDLKHAICMSILSAAAGAAMSEKVNEIMNALDRYIDAKASRQY